MKLRQLKSWALLLLSLILIIFGITNGEVQLVLKKAIHICLECVGLG